MRRLACLLVLLAACDGAAPIDETGPTPVDVLFVYTPAAAGRVGGPAALDVHLARAVAETNTAYANSRVRLRLRRAHAAPVAYVPAGRLADLAALMSPCDGVLDAVHALRDAYAADLVVLVSERPDATINGALMATAATAFAVVHVMDLGAPAFALAHELGHLQGARHSVESGVFETPFPYGHALRAARWKTIMSTGSLPAIPHFANPTVRYGGEPTGTVDRQDVARVLNKTAAYVASFRGPAHPTDFVSSGTWPTVPLVECGAGALPRGAAAR